MHCIPINTTTWNIYIAHCDFQASFAHWTDKHNYQGFHYKQINSAVIYINKHQCIITYVVEGSKQCPDNSSFILTNTLNNKLKQRFSMLLSFPVIQTPHNLKVNDFEGIKIPSGLSSVMCYSRDPLMWSRTTGGLLIKLRENDTANSGETLLEKDKAWRREKPVPSWFSPSPTRAGFSGMW